MTAESPVQSTSNKWSGGRLSAAPWTLLKSAVSLAVTLGITFLGLIAVTFFIGRILPTDPVLAVVGDRASEEVYQAMRIKMGLDQPLLTQFWTFLSGILQGDFGNSLMTSRPVIEDIRRFFPATLELATVATLIGVLVGVPMGVAAAVKQGRWQDHVIRVLGLIGYSVPIFWLGMIGLIVFYARLDLLPGPGRYDIFYEGLVPTRTGIVLIDSAIVGEWEVFRNAAAHLVLPSSMLAFFSLAYIGRMTRSFMLEQLGQEYVLTARVKGLSMRRVVWQHAFPNILVQLITVIGLSYALLLEGAVLTETVFAWPGLGLYITKSLFNSDLNAVIGGTVVIGAVFIVINLSTDVLYRKIDARAA